MNDKIKWFGDARFGMFIHWGLYALPGGIWQGREMNYIGEWIQSAFRIPNAEYAKLAAQFNPTAFDAENWVRIAYDSGMRYVVFTAKHHDGFAMYHSKCSKFNIVDATPFGRDVLAELAAACQKYGLKLGIYYSQDLDWHEQDGGDPGPDHSKNFAMSWGNDWDFPNHAAKNFQRYFDGKVIPQLTELLSNYGAVSVIWFDCPLTISRRNSERLVELVKKLQPDCLVNTRIGHGLGDFGSLGDNQLPSARRQGVWETPGTLNDTWSFKYNDHNWKSPREIIRLLAALSEKDTNYLLNIGPQPDGNFPAASVDIIKTVGQWLDVYGNSIYQSRGNPFPYDFNGWNLTVSPGTNDAFTRINLLWHTPSAGPLRLYGLKNRVRRCYDLAQPEQDLPFTQRKNELCNIDVVTIDLAPDAVTGLLPVITMELETSGEPDIEQRLIPQNGSLRLMPNRGRLHHGQTAAETVTTERGIGAAGELQMSGAHSFLDTTGALVEWHNPADSIEWDVILPDPGTYQIELVTTSRRHSAPWISGQIIRLSYEDKYGSTSWDVTLSGNAVDSAATRCYAQGIAPAETLTLRQPGTGKLSLQMQHPGSAEAVQMALTEVKLTRQ